MNVHYNLLDENSLQELSSLKRPSFYNNYHNNLLNFLNEIYLIASGARLQGIDVSEKIESRIVYDLADRVAKMHDINITNRLRNLLSETTKEKAALKISANRFHIFQLNTKLLLQIAGPRERRLTQRIH